MRGISLNAKSTKTQRNAKSQLKREEHKDAKKREGISLNIEKFYTSVIVIYKRENPLRFLAFLAYSKF
jgi:hypothetical protein